MARNDKVSEDKLQAMVENWGKKDTSELAELLGVGESTISYWAGKLKRSMKAHGMTDKQIKEMLPAKRTVQGNAYDTVVRKLLSSEQAPKRRGRKPREAE